MPLTVVAHTRHRTRIIRAIAAHAQSDCSGAGGGTWATGRPETWARTGTNWTTQDHQAHLDHPDLDHPDPDHPELGRKDPHWDLGRRDHRHRDPDHKGQYLDQVRDTAEPQRMRR